MLELLFFVTIFLVAFFLLLKAGDYFVDAASNLGSHYGMSRIMIGITIVAVGTSLPEIMTSLGSMFFTDNFADFVIGTAMGSNITNILLAFGLFLVISKNFSIRRKENFNVFSLVFSTIIFSIFMVLGFINYFVVGLFIFYIYYIYRIFKNKNVNLEEDDEVETENLDSKIKSYSILGFCILGLFLGAKLITYSIENIGNILLIPTAYLTLTTIAIATSLPEISVTIASARKKKYMLGVGNILGSNIMNICIIIGASGFYGFYLVDSSLYIVSTIVYLIATLSFAFMIYRRKFSHYFGWFFLVLYLLYLLSFFIF